MKCQHDWKYQTNIMKHYPSMETTDKYYCSKCLKIKIIRG